MIITKRITKGAASGSTYAAHTLTARLAFGLNKSAARVKSGPAPCLAFILLPVICDTRPRILKSAGQIRQA